MHQVFNEKAGLSPKLLVFFGVGCIFIKCIYLVYSWLVLNMRPFLTRSAAGDNTDSLMVTFLPGDDQVSDHQVQESTLFKNSSHERWANRKEIFLLQHSRWKKKAYSDSWASTALKCSICIFVLLFSPCVGIFVVGGWYVCLFLFFNLCSPFVLMVKTSLS